MSGAPVDTVDGPAEVDPGTGEIHRPAVLMNEDEARKITADIKAWAGTLWKKLKEAHDGQAWRALGYSSWRDYIDTEFDMGKSQAYRLIAHANAVYELAEAAGLDPEVSPMGDTLSERTTRALDIDEVCTAVRDAVMDLPRDATTSTRLELVESIVAKLKPAPQQQPAPVAPEPERDPVADAISAAAKKASAPATPAAGAEGGQHREGGPDQHPDAEASSAPGAVPSPETRAAEYRARISPQIVAVRRFLENDPAEMESLMSAEDTQSWCELVDDLAQFAHEFNQARSERRKLRSVN